MLLQPRVSDSARPGTAQTVEMDDLVDSRFSHSSHDFSELLLLHELDRESTTESLLVIISDGCSESMH